jgi:SAM-dependent methyltransferase
VKGLSSKQDAYGQAMLDHLEGRGGFTPMIERDDGLVDADFGVAHYFAEKWSAHEREAFGQLGGRVLDVGAGAGRVSLYLQKRGHEVVAIDNSPLAVRVCKERGVRNARVVPFAAIDSSLGTLDGLVMWGNNFGLFGTAKRARWMLRRLKRLTSSGAKIVAQTLDIYQTQQPEHLAYHRFNRRRGRMAGELRIRVRYKMRTTPWFDYMMAAPHEIEAILEGTGWFLERVIARPESPQYVAVIEKET